MSNKTIITAVLFVLGLCAAAWGVILPRLQPHTFHGAVIQSPMPAPPIELESTSGGRVSLSDFDDQLVVVYFGYTWCPDICPTTLSRLDEALAEMGSTSEDVQVVMVTVDPERDTVDSMESYLGHFNDSFIGLTGSFDEVSQVATTYGVFFDDNRLLGEEQSHVDAEYLVDHTSSLMVIGRDGHLRLVLPPDVASVDIAADLEFLAEA